MVTDEVEVTRIEGRLLPTTVVEDGDLAIVDDQFVGYALEEDEGVVMRGQEVFLGLAQGEFHIHPAAVAQDHDEEGEAAAGVADLQVACRSPVHLCRLTRDELKAKEGLPGPGADPRDIGTKDTGAAPVAFLADEPEDLTGAIVVTLQEPADGALEGIELAGARMLGAPLLVLGTRDPLGDGLAMETEFGGDLGDRQSIDVVELAQLAEGLEVDHWAPPALKTRRRMSPTEATSPRRWEGGGVEESGRLRTW